MSKGSRDTLCRVYYLLPTYALSVDDRGEADDTEDRGVLTP